MCLLAVLGLQGIIIVKCMVDSLLQDMQFHLQDVLCGIALKFAGQIALSNRTLQNELLILLLI